MHFYEIWFCSALLQAVCEEALNTGPQVGLFLDAVVFGGEDFRASIGIKHIPLFQSVCACICVCVCVYFLPLHEWTFTSQYIFANHDNGFSAEWAMVSDNLGHLRAVLLPEQYIITSLRL